MVYKPSFTAYLAGGSVYVTECPKAVVVVGPKLFVERLRKRMKIVQHITKVEQSIHDSRLRRGQKMLRRVEINLRVSPDQWQQVHEDVIAFLARHEAEIVCEVHILAQNENGIMDDVVELGVRERLRKRNIPVEIRKVTKPGSHPEINLPATCAN